MSELQLAAVICTHNPRREFLTRTLESLKLQTLPRAEWELVVVDNASQPPAGSLCDLSWHPRGRVVLEGKLGLTHARLCGLQNTRAPVIVYIDDDNLLAPDYFAQALSVGREFPQLGTWGAACIAPEYEKPPAPELEPFCQTLALKKVGRDLWTNLQPFSDAFPFGAGMVVRRAIAEAYAARKAQGELIFDRTGSSLFSSGDYELSLAAADEGMGYGVFRRLSLTHLISAGRVERDYLLRLWEAVTMSNLLLLLLRQGREGGVRFGFAEIVREFLGPLFKALRGPGVSRAFFCRVLVGKWKALRMYRDWQRRGETP